MSDMGVLSRFRRKASKGETPQQVETPQQDPISVAVPVRNDESVIPRVFAVNLAPEEWTMTVLVGRVVTLLSRQFAVLLMIGLVLLGVACGLAATGWFAENHFRKDLGGRVQDESHRLSGYEMLAKKMGGASIRGIFPGSLSVSAQFQVLAAHVAAGGNLVRSVSFVYDDLNGIPQQVADAFAIDAGMPLGSIRPASPYVWTAKLYRSSQAAAAAANDVQRSAEAAGSMRARFAKTGHSLFLYNTGFSAGGEAQVTVILWKTDAVAKGGEKP